MNKLLVHSVFEDVAEKHAQNIAIEYLNRRFTYHEVNHHANRMANSLLALGVKNSDVVAVYLPSCAEYVISIIGVNKAGAAFMPLDLNTPEERTKYLLDKVKPGILITDNESYGTLSNEILSQGVFTNVVIIDNDKLAFEITTKNKVDLIKVENGDNPEINIDPEARNYILYTSGSTGNPKIIEGKYKSLSHFIHWEMAEFEITSSDKISQFAPNSFDVSLRDIFVPLLSGGTLCIPDEGVKSNSHQLLEWIINSELTLIHCVPSLFRLLIEELKAPEHGGLIPRLRYFLLGGDALYGRDVKNWREVGGRNDVNLVNIYGPTETTLAKLFYRIEDKDYPESEIMPLGVPISNTAVLILNDKNELCDLGESGKIFIKTPFISNGYYGDDTLTKEKFIQNPLHNDFDDIVYDTGDLGKFIENNNVQFIGRADNQVKINGNRVELFEIETVLSKYDLISEVVVGIVQNEEEKLVVAYYKGDTEVKASQLENYLKQFLPIYMHPSHYIKLEEFPLNKNGKIDRTACNELFQNASRNEVDDEHIETNLSIQQKQLKVIFQEVLKLENIGVNESFFDLGGTSLKGIRIISRIYKEFGVLFKLPDLFSNPSVAQFDTLILQANGEVDSISENKELSPIKPLEEEQQFYEASHAQRRLWLLHQFEDGQMAYNVPRTFLLEGKLDIEALKFAMKEIVNRHESLRTSLLSVNGFPMQRINADVELNFVMLDLINSKNKENDVNEIIKSQINGPFNLDDQSLIRTYLIKLDEDLHVFAYCMHHIISDGWSSGIIFNELQVLYKNFLEGKSSDLEPLRIQYKDYASWQNEELNKNGIDSHREYWHNKFKTEVEPLDLPVDYARPEVKTYNGENKWVFIRQEVFEKLKSISKDKSLYAPLMATLKAMLYKYCNQTDIVLGAAVAGRDYEDLHEQVGFYVNTLAFRTDFNQEDSFYQLLDKVNTTILEGYEHQIYPFDKLVDDLELKRDTARNPLFDIMTTFINDNEQQQIPELEGLKIHNYNTDYKVSKFDLTFTFVAFEKELEILVNYNTDLFEDSTIDRMLKHFSQLLEAVVNNVHIKLKDIKLVDPSEEQKLLVDFQGPKENVREIGIHNLFLEQASRSASDNALILESGTTFSYEQLASKAVAIGAFIKAKIGEGKRVGIMLDRGEGMVLSMLGTMMSGNICVPIDISFSQEIKKDIIEEAGCEMVISANDEQKFQAGIGIDQLMEMSDSEWRQASVATNVKNKDAYIFYNSGSSSQTKLSHEDVVNLIQWGSKEFNVTSFDKAYCTSSFQHNLSIFEIFYPLIVGKPVKLLKSEFSLQDSLEYENGRVMLTAELKTLSNLIHDEINLDAVSVFNILGGGIPFYIQEILDYDKMEIRVLYGSSITATVSSSHRLNHANREKVIGKPIMNTSIYVLDDVQKVMPIGVWGELYISSTGSINHNEPDKFIKSPFIEGTHLYRTGDIGRWREDGSLEYLAGKKNLVKIRGHHIDLYELENILSSYSKIDEVFIYSYANKGESELMASYTSSEVLEEHELRKYIHSLVPFYMIPDQFVQVREFPRNDQGFVYIEKLKTEIAQNTEIAHVLSETESLLLSIWKDALEQDKIDIDDNFFKLGGHSLKAMKLLTTINKQFGTNIKLSEIFKHPTIKKLGAAIDAKKPKMTQAESNKTLVI